MRALLVLGSLVAQSVERRTVNPLVVGSSPTQGAIYVESFSRAPCDVEAKIE